MVHKLALVVLLLMLSVSASLAQSVVTDPVGFQGRLAHPDGTPVANGNYQITFSVYSAATGGSPLWKQISAAIPVRNGTFAVKLDFTTGFQNGSTLASTFSLTVPYLEIKIGNDPPLTPRQLFTNVVYALYAANALSVKEGAITGASIAAGTITADKFAPDTLNPLAWLLGGNSGVTSGFLGTTDTNPLELRVNNRRAMRYFFAQNTILQYRSMNVLGGSEINSIAPAAVGATITGGGYDSFSGIDHPNSVLADFGTIGGGAGNTASFNYATIGGGANNTASETAATIGGGFNNTASGFDATIAGGENNIASGLHATLAGGFNNTASGFDATIAGGNLNIASETAATIGGGSNNTASGFRATIAGGSLNIASGLDATVAGGAANTAAGDHSFAVGYRAKANHNGTFVWGDSTDTDFASTAANQFLIRATGYVGINTNDPGYPLDVSGRIRLRGNGVSGGIWLTDPDTPNTDRSFMGRNTTGDNWTGFYSVSTAWVWKVFDTGNATLAGTLTQNSDARLKHKIVPLASPLDTILNLRGVSYEWKDASRDKERQIGFLAQEVEKVFPELVRTDEHGYKSVNYIGVVPVLVEAVKTQQKQMDALRTENATLKTRLDALTALVEKLAARK